MKVYTRRGDAGDTDLFGGPRVGKEDARVEAYGAVDEANAAARRWRRLASRHDGPARASAATSRIASSISAARSPRPTPSAVARARCRCSTADDVDALERHIDALEGELEPLSRFVLPGGTAAAAAFHLARTVCRRAERRCVALHRREPIDAASPRLAEPALRSALRDGARREPPRGRRRRPLARAGALARRWPVPAWTAARRRTSSSTARCAAARAMHALLEPGSEWVGRRALRGRLYDLGAFPGCVEGRAGDWVQGELYRLAVADPAALLDSLDRYEGAPSGAWCARPSRGRRARAGLRLPLRRLRRAADAASRRAIISPRRPRSIQQREQIVARERAARRRAERGVGERALALPAARGCAPRRCSRATSR